MGSPMKKQAYILDTDPWLDPDDAVNLLMLTNSPEVSIDLVVTGDEVRGNRARLTRWFLDKMGRGDIPVVQGTDLGNHNDPYCETLLEFTSKDVPTNYIEQIHKVVQGAEKVLYWGMQGLSNLSAYLKAHPESRSKITLHQMGGSFIPERMKGEHNIKMDIPASQHVFSNYLRTSLVMLDTTRNPIYAIGENHPIYKRLQASDRIEHKAVLYNMKEFKRRIGFDTHMHDPLTASVALGQDFVTFRQAQVYVDDQGFTREQEPLDLPSDVSYSMLGHIPDTPHIRVSEVESRAKEFMEFLEDRIFGGK